ncbi:MAG: NADH-dependent [FeFe] hydrogenase, group A6 [Corallococcus sp.]|nr:NADH-dependent [FeFe] hydrogenase, group A6 [Corallococcus sp.]MCM1359606.1 NADH-dependent [FeFe] hydrogenase, group A6 [Corallococcus sp.]MCM1395198.1 NADH-dependent [FeFe] hydrogenase, group A6 [Corallococcus sp.]
MINLKINDIPVCVEEGSTLLEAARSIGIKIPTLCHMKELSELGACRVCVVEVKGMRSLVAACEYPAAEGMEVYTSTKRVFSARKTTLELILSDHRKDCLSCERNTNCELQRLSYKYGCDSNKFAGATRDFVHDDSTEYLVRDNSKCILCRRCVAVCKKMQGVGAIGANERGFDTHIACAFDMKLKNTSCVGCGQCINVCPTGALTEKSEVDRMWAALNDPNKYVVVGTAPAVRAALAEEFDMPSGTNCQGKINTALRYLGFKQVFDVNSSADFTIMEEAHELISRIKDGGKLPMFTSCCPGWITYCRKNYPELLDNLSTCKSPQQMFGALVKQAYGKKMGIKPENIFVVTVMPCTAKKGEKFRTFTDGVADVDAVLTTRELAHVLKGNGILLPDLPDGETDRPFGEYSGAGIIFGATGGVMEAALRTAASVLEPDSKYARLEFSEVRGLKGVKEAIYQIGDKKLKIAVVNGLRNAAALCDKIKSGQADYHFVEVMTCPGGCVMGGGQPIKATFVKHHDEVAKSRASVLYSADKAMSNRRSHNNGSVNEIYRNFLGEPNGAKAHKLLHTTYEPMPKFTKE